MTFQTVEWKNELIEQMDFQWKRRFLPKLQGLADDEYFWEPVAKCWSIRRLNDGVFRMDPLIDSEQDTPPLTTIAWRMNHISSVFGERASNHFGDGSYATVPQFVPGTADAAIVEMTHQRDLWRNGLVALTEEEFARACGPAENDWSEKPLAKLVLHISRELIHHSSEICLLRDLYRYRSTLHS